MKRNLAPWDTRDKLIFAWKGSSDLRSSLILMHKFSWEGVQFLFHKNRSNITFMTVESDHSQQI